MFYLIYPKKRWVGEDWIKTQYADAVANSEIDHERCYETDPVKMAHALSDAGLITLSTEGRH